MKKKPEKNQTESWHSPAYLRRIRESLGYSQQQLAKLSGVSRTIIADLESGRTYFSSLEHGLKLYMVLSASGSAEATGSLNEVARLLKHAIESEIAGYDQELYFLNKRREGAVARLAEITSLPSFMESLPENQQRKKK